MLKYISMKKKVLPKIVPDEVYPKGKYSPLTYRDLPKAPGWKKALGVGVVVMGLAIGTGELIMWPHIVVKYGLGLMWAALLGFSIQYFLNQEIARHALATGESFFTSSARVLSLFAPFWLFSVILLYIWPGWVAAGATALKELFGFGSYLFWGWATLAAILLLTFTGKVAYNMLEKSLRWFVGTFFTLIVIASFLTLDMDVLKAMGKGLVNFGWIPKDIDIGFLLGAIVFAGAGGMLNLCVSLWYRDKQFGMGKYIGRITNPITGHKEAVPTTGYLFHQTPENLKKWRQWMRFVRIDQGLIFWFLGLLTLILLSLNAYAVLAPRGLVPEGLDVAVVQAHIFGDIWGIWGFRLFLLMAFLMMFSCQWTVIDVFTRTISDILYTNARVGPFRKIFGWARRFSVNHIYYGLITVFLIICAILLPFRAPLVLLTISAILGGLTMAIYTPLLLYMNNRRLPKPLRPGIVTNLALVFASGFYLFFAVRLIADNITKFLS